MSLALHDDVKEDLKMVFQTIIHEAQVEVTWSTAKKNTVEFQCRGSDKYRFKIQSTNTEATSTAYYGLHKLGFLFPHPREEIYPKKDDLLKKCEHQWTWEPSFLFRGFHLHTQHPGEWTEGFFGGQKVIAQDIVKWSARNFQNRLQVQGLRNNTEELFKTLKLLKPYASARQIQLGLGVSLVSQQQKSLRLINPLCWILRFCAEPSFKDRLNSYLAESSVDFLTVELGSSEFTSTSPERTLKFIDQSYEIVETQNKKKLFFKLHASTGQTDTKYGNYNFLPLHSKHPVGILPHTTHFYALEDEYTPMYGRMDFSDMKQAIEKEASERPTVYFPETSYFIGMDIDVPLFLTDYLVARAKDLKWLKETQSMGYLNFSTGQELGYWLFDWSLALQANSEYLGKPTIGLYLLNEPLDVWEGIIGFQTQFFKEQQLIQMTSTSNLMDELPTIDPIHDRNLLRDVGKKKKRLKFEIAKLNAALRDIPKLDSVKHPELKAMLQVTWLRIQHAQLLRVAISNNSTKPLELAEEVRAVASKIMGRVYDQYSRYGDAMVFKIHDNPTSYDYGYGYPALELHYWKREEEIVRHGKTNPFFMNLYSLWDLLI